MANVIFKKGNAASLPKTYVEGTIYITTDERGIYLDISNEQRIRIGTTDADIEAKIAASVDKKVDEAITELDLDNTYDPKGAADAKDAAIAEAKQAGEKAQADIAELEEKIGEVESDKTVVQMIEEASYDDSALSARVTKNESAIGILNGGKEQDGSVAKIVAEAVAEIVANAPTDYDTLKEIADWITSHANSASEMNSQITSNKEAIAALKALIGELPKEAEADTLIEYIEEVIDELSLDEYAKATDVSAAEQRAKEYADTLVPTWGDF